ncbi:MAG TPA: glycine cleavage T C-terminal barrel domain-containing protein [Chthoniobacterales bacterium]|nr:glycine cleavage T C-terminal barrel domain-containing protein [Chthoniobacterales bacterium]
MTPAFFDCSDRVKLRLTGVDASRFLNGQVTNDLRKANGASAIQASVLNAKGKLSAHVFISAEEGAFLLDADPELREELPARLERYIIADDVQIEDVTESFSIFHVTGETAPTVPLPARNIAANRFGCPGWDLWIDPSERERLRQMLAADFAFCDDACAEVFRIEQGIPRWGRELTDEIIPVEANLEPTSIDYFKGCYIGQEVVSRMKMSGQTNKRLCGLVSLSGAPLQAGMRLRAEGDAGKDAGWITSATRSARLEKEIALGYVKRGFNSNGTRLQAVHPEQAGQTGISVEVVPIPFS